MPNMRTYSEQHQGRLARNPPVSGAQRDTLGVEGPWDSSAINPDARSTLLHAWAAVSRTARKKPCSLPFTALALARGSPCQSAGGVYDFFVECAREPTDNNASRCFAPAVPGPVLRELDDGTGDRRDPGPPRASRRGTWGRVRALPS